MKKLPGEMKQAMRESLRPDLIYRINQIFAPMFDANRSEDLDFSLCYLAASTRAFNWVTVRDDLWDAGSDASKRPWGSSDICVPMRAMRTRGNRCFKTCRTQVSIFLLNGF